MRRITRPAVKYGFDDKPAITVGSDGRAYVAWSRLLGRAYQTTVYSMSSDGGKTWSAPKVLDPRLVQPQLVTLAAGSGRAVYIAGVDAAGLWIGRSTDGGRRFVVHRGVAPLPGSTARTCIVFGKYILPQQAVRCVGPNPTLAVGKGRVFLTYGVNGADLTRDVAVAVFNPALHVAWRGPIASGKKKADQFWPAPAFDAKTGKLWACFYDTTGDPRRTGSLFNALFGPQAVVERAGGCVVRADAAQVELSVPRAIAAEFGDAAADPAGRVDYLAALELKVSSLADTAGRLRGVPDVRIEPHRVVVPARAAFNTTLAFSA